MRLPLIYKIIAPFLLVVFTISSCDVFVMPKPDTISVPIGKGDKRFFYLDEDYQSTVNDIGKMAMYVENNELTKDVLVLAEIRDDDIDNDVVVRVINRQNNSLVSFFYYRGQYFPHKVVITSDGETIIGKFSLYNTLSEKYSVEFTNKDGGSENYNNLILNKKVFSLHKKDNALTDTQNVRISNIITTLALWNSLAFQMDKDFKVGGRTSRGAIDWKKLAKTFANVAVIATTAVVVLADPTVVTIVGAVIPEPIITTATISITAGTAAVITAIISLLDDTDREQDEPPPNKDNRPQIDIKIVINDIEYVLENDEMPEYYLKQGESLTFNLRITDFSSFTSGNDIININNKQWFAPFNGIFIGENGHQYNAFYFNVDTVGNINDLLQIVVSRNNKNGISEDGAVQLVLNFNPNVIINGKGDGIYYWTGLEEPVKSVRENVFVINLTIKEPPKIED